MAKSSALSAYIWLLALPLLTAAQKDNGDECSCFRTNASTAAYFTNHIFRDFRQLTTDAAAGVPPIIANATGTTAALATSDYFLSDDWNDVWTTQNWNNSDTRVENSASVLMINSPNNVYIESSQDDNVDYSTFLTLRTTRLPGFQSAAEIDSTALNYQYVSMRFQARVIGSPGACAGLFTYLANDDAEKVQEADIEILTSGPRNVVQYTNQPSDSQSGDPKPEATRNSTNTDGRDWTLWNTYRYDWTKDNSAWYVNGKSVANISYQAPKDPTQLMVNMWSDGGLWTGNMSLHDEAYLQIQWMQIAFNTSGPVTGSETRKLKTRDGVGAVGLLTKRNGDSDRGCQVVCAIDEDIKDTGTPVVLYNNTASQAWKGEGAGSMVWMSLILVGGAVFGLI